MKRRIARLTMAVVMMATTTAGLLVGGVSPAQAAWSPCYHHVASTWLYNQAHGHDHLFVYNGHYTLPNGTHWHLWTDLGPGGTAAGHHAHQYAYRC